jgi:hypothetical protein
MVKAYDDAIPAYVAKVKAFNHIHAPVATKKANAETFDKDLAAALEGLPFLKTVAEPPVDSTRVALPEMPYMSVMRPGAFGGPKLSASADAKSMTSGEYLFEMGAGRVTSGWLNLAKDSVKGYGTKGQSAKALSFIHPLQSAVEADCKMIYLGVIAYPLKDQAKGYLNLAIAPSTWSTVKLTADVVKSLPTAPLAREAAAFLAAGAASIALVGMSLF